MGGGAYDKCGLQVTKSHPMRFMQAKDSPLAKMRKKSDLPSKLCVVCARPFVWRKKWAKVWDEVRYCSDRCRDGRG